MDLTVQHTDLRGTKLITVLREFLEAHPELHDQASWVPAGRRRDAGFFDAVREHPCGSRMCAAGWAAAMTVPPGSQLAGAGVTLPDGSRWTVPGWARYVLGLTTDQATAVFHAPTDATAVRWLRRVEENPAVTGYDLLSSGW